MIREQSFKSFFLDFADQFSMPSPQGPDIGNWWREAIKEANEQDLVIMLKALNNHAELVEGNAVLQKVEHIIQECVMSV